MKEGETERRSLIAAISEISCRAAFPLFPFLWSSYVEVPAAIGPLLPHVEMIFYSVRACVCVCAAQAGRLPIGQKSGSSERKKEI